MKRHGEHISQLSPPSAVALWHNSVYRSYWIGTFVSFLGSWMQTVAQGWVVYEITNSKLLLGLLGFVGSLPTTLFSLFGGVVADRIEKRRLVITTQALFAINAFVLAVLILTGRVQFWHIALIAALNGLCHRGGRPCPAGNGHGLGRCAVCHRRRGDELRRVQHRACSGYLPLRVNSSRW
jgi:MFS family permease